MNNMKAAFKGQSAMEYLMTYGWAILVIAIVLVALFSLGVFGGHLSTACIAQSGFSCSGPIYVHGNNGVNGGNVIVTVGQETGQGWTATNVIFLNTTNLGLFQAAGNFGFAGAPGTNALGTLNSGGTATVTIPVSSNALGSTALGTSISGTVWASYKIGATTYYASIGTLTASAT